MRGNKRLVQGIAVAGATGVLACAVAFSQPQIMQTEETIKTTGNSTANLITARNVTTRNLLPQLDDLLEPEVSVEKLDVDTVSSAVPVSDLNVWTENAGTKVNVWTADAKAAADAGKVSDNADTSVKIPENAQTKDVQAKEKAQAKEKTQAKEKKVAKEKNEKKAKVNDKSQAQTESAKKWKNKLMADVDDCLNIRKAPSEDSQVLGKLRKGDAAKVLKKGKNWTKIKSGSVTGYVNNEYCVYGEKAYKLAKKICKMYATVQADGLRIRQKASENSIALEAAFKGDKLVVNQKAKQKDGWVVIQFNDGKGYVSEEFVKVGLGVGEAISIEEEQAMLAAQKKAEQAALRSASSSSASSSTAAASSSAVSSSDLTLLSAIIFCEAGGESYAGQVAVGAVVMNRVRSGSFPNNISDVVYQSGQFSPVANGALSRALSNGNYRHCTSAAQAALAGSDNTGGAKFFHRVNGAAGLVIGNHVFY